MRRTICTTDRDELRRWIPASYRPWLHLGGMFGLGLAGIVYLVLAHVARGPATNLLAVPPMLIGASLVEYAAHRWLMHLRRTWTEPAWAAHVGRHHHYYLSDAPTWDRPRDVWLILFSPIDIVALVAIVAGPLAVVWYLVGGAAGALVVATCIGYFLAYEALHLTFHLPDDHPVLRVRALAAMRAHHLRHHLLADTHANYAVVLPLWDRVFRTASAPLAAPALVREAP